MLRAAALILAKDARLRARDRSVWLFALVVPIGLTFLFSSIFPDTGELELTAGVVDLDGGEVAAGFVDGVLPAIAEDDLLTLVAFEDEEHARAQVADGTADAAWILPAGFSESVARGQDARIEVLVSAGRTLPGEVARGVAEAYASRIEQVGLALTTEVALTGAPPDPALAGAIADAAADTEALIALETQTAGTGQPLDAVSYLAAGMASFFVFFVVQFGVTGLLEERQLGTLQRLKAAPIRSGAIQLGKLMGAFLLGLASMTALSVASTTVLGASWGPTPGVVILVVALVLAAIGVMALVGTFARTAEQAGNYQSIVAIVLGLSGGVFFPIPGDNLVMQIATRLSPHGWFIRGMDVLSTTGRWSAVLPAAAAILAFGVVAAIPAVVIERRRSSW